MSQLSLSSGMHIRVPLMQLWEAFKDLHRMLPRLLPGFVESCTIVSGGGGPGSVREIKFCSGVPGVSLSKEEIEVVNELTHVYTYNVLESEILKSYSSYRVTWKFDEQVEGAGTDVTWTAEFVPMKDEERPERFKDSSMMLLRQLEGHLLATGEYSQPTLMDSMREELLV